MRIMVNTEGEDWLAGKAFRIKTTGCSSCSYEQEPIFLNGYSGGVKLSVFLTKATESVFLQ